MPHHPERMNAMQIETPPTEKRYEKPEGERRGLVIVNTGDGKGKSTAAFGLALRAHGRGKAVKIFQFMKVPTARFGEHRMFEQIGLPIQVLALPAEAVAQALDGMPICSNMRCSPKRAVGTFMNWKIFTALPRPWARSARPKAAVLLPLPSPVLTMTRPRRSPSGFS